ncbi:RNA-directed DNA polymerase from transposon BS [Paramuricea clavata]|uniref:RNA-directed DNA polymerase from transposon BS n=1 Tax=Paramuricea clavata TaxID=317549 RepID=A0A7D9K8N9_PARCT|nr:RNA-directed DNA polymerase from transposon BS [Paramuricea clavata]
MSAVNSTLLEHSNRLEQFKNQESDSEAIRLRNENLELKKENGRLTEQINNLSCTLTDLQDKVKQAEEEKASLITAIWLLNKELGVNQPLNSSESTGEKINSDEADDCQRCQQLSRAYPDIPTQNRYSTLAISGPQVIEETVEAIQRQASGQGLQAIEVEEPVEAIQSQASGQGQTSTSTQDVDKSSDKPKSVLIIGDSIIKHIDPRKLSKKTVYKRSFPGKRVEEIHDEIDNIQMNDELSYVIIHAIGKTSEAANGVFKPNTSAGTTTNPANNPTNDNSTIQETSPLDVGNDNSGKACRGPTMGEFDSSLHCVARLKGLKIASINVNSLLKHIEEIRHLLFKFPFDIFAINESKIDDFVMDGEISIPGFNLIRKDRNRAGGGVVLYIRDNLSYLDRNDLVPDRLEMLCAEITRPFSKSLFVCTWYRPENKELIIIGDINCDVMKTSPDAHTRQLNFLCSLYQLDQLINKPTRETNTSATLIDLVLTNAKENISTSGVINMGCLTIV